MRLSAVLTLACLFPTLRPLPRLAAQAVAPVIAQSAPVAEQSSSVAALPAGNVTMVVYSDFACPYSSDLFFTVEKLKQRYPDLLHVIYKQSPLPIHPEAPLAHQAALAAGRQGHFDQMAELLYANHTQLSAEALISYARQLHLDIPRFRRDLNSPEIVAQIAADVEESHGMGVVATPTLFINGKRMDGEQQEAALAAILVKSAAAADAAKLAGGISSTSTSVDPALFAAMQVLPTAARGPSDAPLTIVEFTDFQCPFCRSAVSDMETFVQAHGRQVRWIVRSFPLDFHPDSELANEAALAAGEQGKFWEMHDLLFGHQSALKPNDLRTYAQQLNLNMHDFDDALATHRFAGRIAADRALGERAGVTGTPTFIVDGHMMTGARSLPELNQILDAHLAPSASPAPGSQPQLAPLNAEASPVPSGSERVIAGPSSAPLTLTWFTDVRSPLAARQAELIRSLSTRYDGRIRVMVKVFPLASRPDSRISSAALLAAFQMDKFWAIYDAMAARRDVLDREKLIALAASLQLDPTAFLAALDRANSQVTADMDEADRRGVQGAPVIFLNAQRVDGLQREEFYTTLAQAELAGAPATQASLSTAAH